MKNVVKLLLFIVYLISIFYINNIFILLSLLAINFIIIILFKLGIFRTLKHLLVLLPFVLFTTLINILISGFMYGLFICVRLLLAYVISYIFINMVSIKEISNAIEILLTPLSIFKLDTKQISLIISIAISILPNILNDFEQKYFSIKSKTFKFSYNNILTLFKALFMSLLIITNEFNNTLIAKGYSSDK